jgi:hypothetical protein
VRNGPSPRSAARFNICRMTDLVILIGLGLESSAVQVIKLKRAADEPERTYHSAVRPDESVM